MVLILGSMSREASAPRTGTRKFAQGEGDLGYRLKVGPAFPTSEQLSVLLGPPSKANQHEPLSLVELGSIALPKGTFGVARAHPFVK